MDLLAHEKRFMVGDRHRRFGWDLWRDYQFRARSRSPVHPSTTPMVFTGVTICHLDRVIYLAKKTGHTWLQAPILDRMATTPSFSIPAVLHNDFYDRGSRVPSSGRVPDRPR